MPRERAYIAAEKPWLAADIVVAGADLTIGALGRTLRDAVRG